MNTLYRLLLFTYPAAIRDAFGADMAALFRDLVREEHRRGGVPAAASVIARTFVDLPFSAFSARRAERTAHASPATRGLTMTRQAPLDPRRDPKRPFNGFRNVRFALRGLLRQPTFAAVVIFTLAVGIGANTVMFTVLNGVLLSPLPYTDADRLVRVYSAHPENPESKQFLPGAGFIAYREHSEVFESLGAVYTYRQTGADLTSGDETQRIAMMPTSAGFFAMLGVEPFMGREFLPEEETGDTNVAVISYGLWQTAFAADPAILDREIDLQGVPHTVVGVMPAGFRNPIGGEVDLWRPENLQLGGRNSWGNYYLSGVGRLRDGLSVQQAQDALKALGASMVEENPRTYGTYASIYPLLDDTVGESRTMLLVLMSAVGMVLLIACVNVANLFLVRGADRWKELAVRAALGAGRSRLVGQMLTESLVLGLAGGLGGLLLSFVGLRIVVAMTAETLPRVAELGVDTSMLAFTTFVSVFTSLLFGLAPALRFSRPNLELALREDGRGHSGGSAQRRLRNALVVAEVALALVLLFGAGLLTKSFRNLTDADLGITSGGVLTYEVHLPMSRYPEARDRVEFYERYFTAVEAIPGVESVGATSYLPSEGQYHVWSMGREDLDLDDDDSWTGTEVRVVDGAYLDLMGIQLIRGRSFDSSDTLEVFEGDAEGEGGRGAALINESLAETAFPDRDPLGSMVTFGGDAFQVVGIVSDTAYNPLGETSRKIYASHRQFAGDRNWPMIQTVRTAVAPQSIVDELRAELRVIDPQLVVYRVRTMDNVVAHGISAQRFAMVLMGGFAGVALLLAAVGIYGVLSYTVTQRTREIGIRMALGADRGSVRAMVLRQGLGLTAVGVIIGTFGALALAGWLSTLLFDVQPQDPGVLVSVALFLTGVAALAGYLPTRRATSVDPIQALRKD